MRLHWIIVPAFLALGACGDPLVNVERVSEGAVLPEQTAATVLPTQAELAREESVLSELFQTPADGKSAEPPVAENLVATAETERSGKGLFGWLRNAAVAEAAPDAIAEVPQGTDDVAVLDLDAGTGPGDTEIAALAPEVIVPGKATGPGATRTRRSRFERSDPGQIAGLALRDVPLDAQLPFGEMGRVCDARAKDLGTLVDQAARKGAGYRLYDSAPESDGPRSFYVTGFSDNCPRKFAAALAIFGTPEFHEQLRYGLPADE